MKPSATARGVIRRARSGGADPRRAGYEYSGKFASFNKIATTVAQVLKKLPDAGRRIGTDVETLAVIPSTRLKDRVADKVVGAIRKLKREDRLNEALKSKNVDYRVARFQPENVGEGGQSVGLFGGRSFEHGQRTIDPTAHGFEFATNPHKRTGKVMEDLRNLIVVGGEATAQQGGKLTGYATMPQGSVSRAIEQGTGRRNPWLGHVAGGHIHTDAPEAYKVLQDIKALNKLPKSEQARVIKAALKKEKGLATTPEDKALSGGLGSVLAHLTAPGSVGRAAGIGGPYGNKPIASEYKIKRPAPKVTTVELRSAPTFVADPDLARATLDQTRLMTEHPEAYRMAKKFMEKRRTLTPHQLLSSSKHKSDVLNEIERINSKVGVTSDPALHRVFERAAANQTFADEGMDLLDT